MGVPQTIWFIMENPLKILKMDDLGVPYFRKPPHDDIPQYSSKDTPPETLELLATSHAPGGVTGSPLKIE